jgi:hypothetical protein
VTGQFEYAWIPLVAAVSFFAIVIISGMIRKNPCAWGRHKKRYVALRDIIHCGHSIDWGARCTYGSCVYSRHQHHIQDARWICVTPGCKAIGEHCIDQKGIWLVHQGELVRDEKRIVAWQDKYDLR